MRSEDDRRARGTTRIPFEGLVEVGGAVGPAFEATAVDVSEEGMHLRTAYLPDVGQHLSCRFDAGPGATVLASGEVVWRKTEGRGGEFGVRFENLDDESVDALRRLTGTGDGVPASDAKDAPPEAIAKNGTKVRLHIEGLGSPMRARVKDAKAKAVTVGSELGFLQVGKELELEDAGTGEKRPARIDRVDVELDEGSRVPNLVVTLKYADAGEAVSPLPSTAASAPKAPKADAKVGDEDADLEAIKRASGGIQGAIARGAAKIGPAVGGFARRAQVTAALLAERARGMAKRDGAGSTPLRRTTAPPPGGGLHASGRRVVRGESMPEIDDGFGGGRVKVDRRKLVVGGVLGVGLIVAAIAMRKPAAQQAAAPAPQASAPIAAAPVEPSSPAGPVVPGGPAPMTPGAQAPVVTMPPSTITPNDPFAQGPLAAEPSSGPARPHKPVAVAPFGNGAVTHGTVLRIKMDGPIERIQGAQQPTGFTVVVPGRRSTEPAGPLAARDGRIASIRVANESAGAELAVAFRDGVPNYQVRAKNDVLEIVLASMGAVADTRPEPGAKHGRGKHAAAPHAGKHAAGGKHPAKKH